jgi:hypothetical protein
VDHHGGADRHCRAWDGARCEGMFAVTIDITAAQVPSGDSASCRSAYDRWGTGPKPSSATVNSSTTVQPQNADTSLCERYPVRAFHRTLDKRAVPLDLSCRSDAGLNPAPAFRAYEPCKWPSAADDEDKTRVLPLRRLPVDNCPNTAICWPVQGRLETACRKCDIGVREQVPWARASFANVLCTVLSNKAVGCTNQAVPFCIGHSEAVAISHTQLITAV